MICSCGCYITSECDQQPVKVMVHTIVAGGLILPETIVIRIISVVYAINAPATKKAALFMYIFYVENK